MPSSAANLDQRRLGALVCGQRRELENIIRYWLNPSLLEDSTPNRLSQGQAAASGGGCLATCMVLWLRESGNIIWRLPLGVRVPVNVRKILDLTDPYQTTFSHTTKTTYQ